MSRLDSFIRRLEAQRACLDATPDWIAGIDGPILELGLGNGRTYDHLRGLHPTRAIYVFERQPAAHPDCMPDREHLILGDIRSTLPAVLPRLPGRAAMVHNDLGTGDARVNAELALWLAVQLPPLVRRLARMLPPDVRVRALAEVPAEFDARFAALRRHYRYRVATAPHGAEPLRARDTVSWPHSVPVGPSFCKAFG